MQMQLLQDMVFLVMAPYGMIYMEELAASIIIAASLKMARHSTSW
jgi:hypothetical protein